MDVRRCKDQFQNVCERPIPLIDTDGKLYLDPEDLLEQDEHQKVEDTSEKASENFDIAMRENLLEEVEANPAQPHEDQD